MADLIDREKLKAAMYHRAFETDGDTMWQSGCWVRYRAIEDVINRQPSAQPKWIPCEKGLPGIREEVIATDGAFVYVASRCWYPDTNATVWENSDGWTIDAKAWMPLPEPYKGGTDG